MVSLVAYHMEKKHSQVPHFTLADAKCSWVYQKCQSCSALSIYASAAPVARELSLLDWEGMSCIKKPVPGGLGVVE